MNSFKTLTVHVDSRGVMTVRLNRPDVRNCFNVTMIEELARVFGVEALDPGVKVVVFRGEGPVFCAGGDLNWMKASVDLSLEENLKDAQRLSQMFAVINDCPKVVIGAVHGAAIGGGVGMVAVCDIVIATEKTQFSLSEVRLGIVPACIGPFVILKVGASQARRLFLSAQRFEAPLAKEIGLVHETVSDEKHLDSAIEGYLGHLLQCSPNALRVAKKLVHDLTWPERREKVGNSIDHVSKVLSEIRVSSEGQEGVRAFLEKRKPSWLTSSSEKKE